MSNPPDPTDCLGSAEQNARNSLAAAGWYEEGSEPSIAHWLRRLKARQNPKWDSFSWLTVRALFESINDVFAKAGPTIVRHRRARWISGQTAAGVEHKQPYGIAEAEKGGFGSDFVVDWTSEHHPRFILMGDPGEADASQYAVIDPLLEVHKGDAPGTGMSKPSDFMVIVSDVIYPAGDINEYVNGFYRPYREYDAPIYALPGNHDWYDGLNGFMFHFCAAEPLPPVTHRRWSYGPGELSALLLWRGASRPDREGLAPWMTERRNAESGRGPQTPAPCSADRDPAPGFDKTIPDFYPANRPVQPAPYHAIDTGPLLLVSIDTGISGELDAEQGQWLRRVSMRPKPKILLTGKPIYVNNDYHPCEIVWGDEAAEEQRIVGGERRPITVDDIVREPANNYVAAIGGDIHNYQRYPVRLSDGRTIQYIVSGGGGAYLTATHMIPTVGPTNTQDLPPDVEGFKEKTFRCYPLRGDSLALFARRIGPVVFNLILSAWALIPGALLVLLLILDLRESERIAIAGSAFLAAFLVLAVVIGFVARDAIIASTRSGYRAIAIGSAAAIIAAAVATILAAVGDPLVSAAVGITLGLPFLILIGLMVAYEARGSGRSSGLSLLVVAPAIALWEIFEPFDVDGWQSTLLYVLLPALSVPAVVWVVEHGRSSLGPDAFWGIFKVAVALAWVALTIKLLADHEHGSVVSSEAWLTQTVVTLLVTSLLIARVIPQLSGGSRRKHQTHQFHGLGETATAAVGISLATIALLALDAIGQPGGGGWPADVVAGAFSALAGAFSVLILLATFYWLRMNPRTFFHLRTGVIDPDEAAVFVSQQIGGDPPARPAAAGVVPGKGTGMADAVRRLGRAVSELADTNEPPFYKSFLSVEADEREAVVRCHGVTGYCKAPTVEDCVRISFGSSPGSPSTAAPPPQG